ncbi:Uma2 family endonuclease [Armatimonas rosea]|uniref:Uma2 family endonuclease n=1 Tax=Armatimonas rosea TaxID=685828 RepID=A0A7W9SS15_ARMRO|nr:Uma2 family endonuclease [Armatimonas rosea]MBB6051776.1 Uma2 family endonuclease [Armatimonas rosea]
MSATKEPATWHWTRETYHQAVELGLFGTSPKVELIRGEIYLKTPMNRPHATAVVKSEQVIQTALGETNHVQSQVPIGLSTDGEPEPDIAIIIGQPDDYTEHPTEHDVLLVMEISDSTLAFDKGLKSEVYAEAGIAEYWILDINARTLEVRREPHGTIYRSTHLYDDTQSAAPLAKPDAQISVAALLPK